MLEYIFTEIDLYVLTLQKTSPKPEYRPQQVFNLQGATVGALQSGANFSATVTLTVGAEIAELAQAFSLLKQVLQETDGLFDDQKDEVIELVDDDATQLGRVKPNRTKIAVCIEGVSSFIQNIAGIAFSVPVALDAVRTAWIAISRT